MSTPTVPSPARSQLQSHSHHHHHHHHHHHSHDHQYASSSSSSSSFHRADLHAVRQELHDALGENGLPYWKALNGYLLGKVGRGELGELVKGWLKGDKLVLHDRLLVSLLYNASAPHSSSSALSSLDQRKRKRVPPDDPEYDTDDNVIEPKSRVPGWVMGISGKERARLRRVALGGGEEGGEDGRDIRGKGAYLPNPTMPPMALPSRLLPSSSQLSQRLASLAKAYDLSLPAEGISDVGEFLAIGMDQHLSDVLHSLVHLTGHDRPGTDAVRIPKGIKAEQHDGIKREMDVDGVVDVKMEDDGEIPKPTLETLQALFELNSALHQPASPALYKLQTSLTRAEVKVEREEDVKPALTTMALPKAETTAARLLDSGLLKLDKAGRHSEAPGAEAGEGKKERKHNLHWKYEDPALILKDVLG